MEGTIPVGTVDFSYEDTNLKVSFGAVKVHRGTIELPVTFTGSVSAGFAFTVTNDKETRAILAGVSEGWTLSEKTVTCVDPTKALTLQFTAVENNKIVDPGNCTIALDDCIASVGVLVGQTTGTVQITAAGDIDGNGKINGRDVLLLAQYQTDKTKTVVLGSADVDGNNKNNGRDVLLLAQYQTNKTLTIY